MKTVKLSAASRFLAEYAEELNDDIVVVMGDDEPLARISHTLSTAAADRAMSTALRSVGLPRRTVQYVSGALGRAPCIHGPLPRLATTECEKCGLAALVRLKDVDRESLALSVHPEFLDLIGRARDEFSEVRNLSFSEMRKAVRSRRKANKRRIQPTAQKKRRD